MSQARVKPAIRTKFDWVNDFNELSARSLSTWRTEWDDKDTQRLEKAFSKYNKLPSTATPSIIDNDLQLSTIRQREGLMPVYNKVKNLFKKKK